MNKALKNNSGRILKESCPSFISGSLIVSLHDVLP